MTSLNNTNGANEMASKLITARVDFTIEVDENATEAEILDMMRDFLVDQVGYIEPEILETETVDF